MARLTSLPMRSIAPAEPNRPTHDYTSAKNFMNDPNGLIDRNGIDRTYYQYDANGTTAGQGSGGQATSKDPTRDGIRAFAVGGKANLVSVKSQQLRAAIAGTNRSS